MIYTNGVGVEILGLGFVLIGFVAIMFGLTVVKVTEGQFAEALAGVSRSE